VPINAQRIQTVFVAAAEIADPVERAKFLDSGCEGDVQLRSRVEALLRAHDQPDSLLDRPAVAPHDPNSASTRTFGPEGGAAQNDEVPLGFLTPSTRPDSLGRIMHYEVLQVLGQGGFGIVFRAFDEVLQRVVAVKVLAPQLAATSPARKRFLREARTSGAIRHENVVQVHEVGEAPLPYLVMEFIPGETLQQRLDRIGPVEAAEVVRIGRQIAEGLAAAHATDLIHRDIKPGNILLESGQEKVKITDFGLARAADDASISQSGIIAGTPMYMAPEQALGHKLDQRADLFSLGSVLYQMAAGRAPFRANSTVAVLKRVADDTPRDIREIIPETPQWLCDIIAKLHAKNPDERYQSARDVADVLADCEAQLKAHAKLKDFSRIPRGKAKPSGRRRWLAAAALLLLPTIALAVTEGTGVTHWLRGQQPTVVLSPRPDPEVTPKSDPNTVSSAVEVKQFKGHRGPIRGVALSPDDAFAVSCSGFPDGDRTIRLWNVAMGTECRVFEGHTDQVESVVFSEDGQYLLSTSDDQTARLWEVATGKEIQKFTGHTDSVTVGAFSQDGSKVATGGHDGTVRLWDAHTGREIAVLLRQDRFVRGLSFSPNGRRLVAGVWDGTARVFDLETHEEVRLFTGHDKAVWQVAFMPDNRRVVSGGDEGTLILWDADTGEVLTRMTGHARQATCLSITADGRYVLSGGGDGTVRLFEVQTGKELSQFGGYTDVVWGVAISRDGRRGLFAGGGGFRDGKWQVGNDWSVRLWQLPIVPLPEVKELAPSSPEAKTPPVAVAPFTDADVQRIAALPAAEQVEDVRKELVKRNPGFDGTSRPPSRTALSPD